MDVDVTKSFSSLLSFSIFLKLISNIHQSITYYEYKTSNSCKILKLLTKKMQLLYLFPLPFLEATVFNL